MSSGSSRRALWTLLIDIECPGKVWLTGRTSLARIGKDPQSLRKSGLLLRRQEVSEVQVCTSQLHFRDLLLDRLFNITTSSQPAPAMPTNLPTEVLLQILRYALLAQPPYIDACGQIKHKLLSKQLISIQREVLDVIFHNTIITIPSEFLQDSLRRFCYRETRDEILQVYIRKQGVLKRISAPGCLYLHDEVRKHKSQLIRLVVQDDPSVEYSVHGLLDRTYELLDWANAIGLYWECVDMQAVVQRCLRFYEPTDQLQVGILRSEAQKLHGLTRRS